MNKPYIVVVFDGDEGIETYGPFAAFWKANEFAKEALNNIDVVRVVVSEISQPSSF